MDAIIFLQIQVSIHLLQMFFKDKTVKKKRKKSNQKHAEASDPEYFRKCLW